FPSGQTPRRGRRAHLRPGDSNIGQWGANPRGPASGPSRPMLPQIVRIGAVAYDRQTTLAGQGHEPRPELCLTVEAAIGGVGEVIRVLELVGFDLEERDIELLGHVPGRAPLRVGIGRPAPDGGP